MFQRWTTHLKANWKTLEITFYKPTDINKRWDKPLHKKKKDSLFSDRELFLALKSTETIKLQNEPFCLLFESDNSQSKTL